jgi:hypothetical protein
MYDVLGGFLLNIEGSLALKRGSQLAITREWPLCP